MTSEDDFQRGEIAGQLKMIIAMHHDESKKSADSRREVHDSLEALRSDVQGVKHDIAGLRKRVDAVEPAAETVRQWSQSKTAIITLFTVLLTGISTIGAGAWALWNYLRQAAGS